jgi:SAM-dependent methyltransferase
MGVIRMTHDATSRSTGKWPKILPPLTEEQLRISNDWMHHWHLINREKYSGVVNFGHEYVAKRKKASDDLTLEIGAGLGAQLTYEVQSQNTKYIAMEYRWNMVQALRKRFPNITCCLGDCQGYLPLKAKSMDRVVAIHVLEHLPNLPACIQAIQLILKDSGLFFVVIPCEGGMAYEIARYFTSRRMFEKRYRTPYKWFIRSEHVNTAWEILEELDKHFSVIETSYYPFHLPWIHLNAVIGLTLAPRPIRPLIP